jgi:pyruvate formate lyase activating enzyme
MHPAKLWTPRKDNAVQCGLCNHFCRIENGEYGLCGVRVNEQGSLYTLVYDKVAAANIDPIEKKPLFHFLPGTWSFSIGTMGCNLACAFCQNDSLSQGPKQSHKVSGQSITPEQIVQSALKNECQSISYTYSEPTIFYELMYDTSVLAQKAGLKNILVSNGFMSTECLHELGPYADAINVDLKAFRDEFYKTYCQARLKPVLNNLKTIKEIGWWLEVTTLVIPGLNDSQAELQELANFLAHELGPEVPWHISRFHPAYKMQDRGPTPVSTLEMAYDIGKQAGLDYVYLGNVPGHSSETTFCPRCKEPVIKRRAFTLGPSHMQGNTCGNCGAKIPGVFV